MSIPVVSAASRLLILVVFSVKSMVVSAVEPHTGHRPEDTRFPENRAKS